MRLQRTIPFLIVLGVIAGAVRADAATSKATFTAGAFLVSVDGGGAALVSSVEGGNTLGQVLAAGGAIPNKRLTGQVLVQPMKIRFAPGTALELEKWLGDGLLPGVRRSSGEVKLLDSTGKSASRRTFQTAGIQTLTIPALDGTSKAPLSLTVGVKPSSTTYETDSSAAAKINPKGKTALEANFRLSIDGVDTTSVAKIDSLTITQVLSATGVPQSVEVSNLVVSLAANSSAGWFSWFDDMLAAGDNSDVEEREGKIEFLGSNRQEVLGTVELHGLGLISIGAERADGWVTKKGAASASERVKAEMYCERVSYKPAS